MNKKKVISGIMDAITRINKDLVLFEKNLKEIENKNLSEVQKKIVQMAINYAHDTTYYLEKEDHLTAFGCITYAHGLLDSVRLMENLI